MNKPSALDGWTPEQLALAKRWVETWKLAAADLERIRRKESENSTPTKPFRFFADRRTTRSLHMAKAGVGLLEQQRWFKKAACRE